MSKIKYTEKGQALILIVMGIFGIIALVALAIDGGNAFADRRHAQSAADTAVLAAALAKVNNNDWQSAAFSRALDNGYMANGPDSTVTVISPPAEGKYSCGMINSTPPAGDSCDEYVQVIIVSSVKTWFAPIVGVNSITNRVNAVARAKPAITQPFAFGHAMVSLNSSACRAFEFSGSSQTLITSDSGAGVFVNSSCSTALGGPQQGFYQGSGTITAPSISVVGGAYYDPDDITLTSSTVVATGATQMTNINIIWPTPTCSGTAEKVSGSNEMTPGNYDGGQPFPPNNVEVLRPGIYCVNNANVSINSDLTGQGVMIYVKTGSVSMNGSAEIHLSAPATGQYAGLLFYLPPSNTKSFSMNGNNESTWLGMILAPSSQCTINGSGAPDGLNSQIICDMINVSGDGAVHINYNNGQNYDPTSPPQIELTQ
jgi:hypothetical protein